MRLTLLIRIVWCLGLVLLLSWFTWQHLVPSGSWITVRTYPGSSRRVGEFFPAERVAELADPLLLTEARTISVEPVYFDVRVPREFARVAITMTYTNPDEVAWRLGVREQVQEWRWRLAEPTETHLDRLGRQVSMVTLPLSGIDLTQGHYTFILSAPDLAENPGRLVVNELSLAFTK